MYQIDSVGVATSLPAPAAAGTPGYFTNGNPATATPATVLDGDFFNAIMLELLNIVTGAGLTPAKGANNQVLAAINALITGSVTSSLGTSGWRKLADGSIEQWGTGVLPASGASLASVGVTFPTPFATACYDVQATPVGQANTTSGGTPSMGLQGTASTTGFTALGDCLGYTTFNKTVPFTWRAIGK